MAAPMREAGGPRGAILSVSALVLTILAAPAGAVAGPARAAIGAPESPSTRAPSGLGLSPALPEASDTVSDGGIALDGTDRPARAGRAAPTGLAALHGQEDEERQAREGRHERRQVQERQDEERRAQERQNEERQAQEEQEEERQTQDPMVPARGEDLVSWPTPWISEVPSVDLTGTWRFLPDRSDPMLETWRGEEVLYRIRQESGRIVLEFVPGGGRTNEQTYRWDGSTAEFERGETQVRERARWSQSGRTLEIVGRWWLNTEPTEIHEYTYRYRLERSLLVFEQRDDSGTTTWRFRRVADEPGVR